MGLFSRQIAEIITTMGSEFLKAENDLNIVSRSLVIGDGNTENIRGKFKYLYIANVDSMVGSIRDLKLTLIDSNQRIEVIPNMMYDFERFVDGFAFQNIASAPASAITLQIIASTFKFELNNLPRPASIIRNTIDTAYGTTPTMLGTQPNDKTNEGHTVGYVIKNVGGSGIARIGDIDDIGDTTGIELQTDQTLSLYTSAHLAARAGSGTTSVTLSVAQIENWIFTPDVTF